MDVHATGDVFFDLDRTGFEEVDRKVGETPGLTFVTLVAHAFMSVRPKIDPKT